MTYQNLVLLAPCHGLEDFPLYHTGTDAASLLACWTSLWHPQLLAGSKRLPRVERCDYPPDQLADTLFLLPKPCELELAEELPDEIAAAGSILIRDKNASRSEILKAALANESQPMEPEIIRDFLALGFTLLQVELLTQQMRYGNSIDESRIQRLVFEAADLACSGDLEQSREKLTACHDALADERSHYYPVDVYFLDLTLLSEEVLTPELTQGFADPVPQNVLSSAHCIELLKAQVPVAAAALQTAIEEQRIGIAGGEYQELPLAVMSPNSLIRQLEVGTKVWQDSLGASPSVFARRRTGLYPSAGYAIRNSGKRAALHIKLDEGTYPESTQSKTKWAVNDRPIFDCLGRQPLSANVDQTFLELPRELSDAMDSDFVAVRAFWHWPGHVVPWYRDLRRAARFGTALGKFVTLEEFFEHSAEPQVTDSMMAHAYRYPFLKKACKDSGLNPVSNWANYWKNSIGLMSARGVHAMAHFLGKSPDCVDKFDEFEDVLAKAIINPNSSDAPSCGVLDESTSKCVEATRAGLSVSADTAASCKTVVNSLPFPRRIVVNSGTGSGDNVFASECVDGRAYTLVDVPGMGFASYQEGPPEALSGPDLAEALTLRNEFFQAEVDETTGSLRSFRDYKSRTTRLSQQVALRISLPKTGQHWVDRQAPVGYSIMAADSTKITAQGKVFAEITAQGRMLAPNGEPVGEFVQRYQVTRGSRVLNLEIEIKPVVELLLPDEPWDSYYASRFAFGDESAIFVAGRHLQAVDVATRRFEAPLFVDIDSGGKKTSVLTGGLPYHRRAADRQFDTILIAGNEQATTFRLGIAADLPTSVTSAVSWIEDNGNAPVLMETATGNEASGRQGWLLHVSAKNVLANLLTPINGGIKLTLIETEGRGTKFRVTGYRGWKTFERCGEADSTSQPIPELSEGAAVITLRPYEMAEFQATFA